MDQPEQRIEQFDSRLISAAHHSMFPFRDTRRGPLSVLLGARTVTDLRYTSAMGQKRALVVDDSKSARVILSRMLEKYDIEVDMAESAEQAIEYLRHDRPDAIFMDHLMPGMDGLQAVQAIKSNPQTAMIPIMMYTSQEGELYVGQARALGAMGVLPKQVRPVDVSKVLYELHLLPDRRDLSEPALVPVEIATEPGTDKTVTTDCDGAVREARRIGAGASRPRSSSNRSICAASSSRASTVSRRASSPICAMPSRLPPADAGGASAAPPLVVAVGVRSGRRLPSGGAFHVSLDVDPRRSRQGACRARRTEGRRRGAQADQRSSRRLAQGSLGRRRRLGRRHAGLGAGLERARRGRRLAALGTGSLRRAAFRSQPPGSAARRARETGGAEFPRRAQGHQFARHVLPGRQRLRWIRARTRRARRRASATWSGIPSRKLSPVSSVSRSRSPTWWRASGREPRAPSPSPSRTPHRRARRLPIPRAPIHSPPGNGTGRRRPTIAWSTPRSPSP